MRFIIFSTPSAAALVLLLATTTTTNGKTTNLPPGCQCTMAQCCDVATRDMFDCELLSGHALHIDVACAPFLNNGTLNANASTTTVCDAILQYERFEERFVSGRLPETSVWVGTTAGATCQDLMTNDDGGCPAKPNPAADGLPILPSPAWTAAIGRGACTRFGTQATSFGNDTVYFSQRLGCAAEGNALHISNEVLLSQDAVDALSPSGTYCPTQASLVFNDATANGVDQKRWMCEEYTTVLSDIHTTVRNVYVNLGRFPCQENAPSAPPTTQAPTTPAPTMMLDSQARPVVGMPAISLVALPLLVWTLLHG